MRDFIEATIFVVANRENLCSRSICLPNIDVGAILTHAAIQVEAEVFIRHNRQRIIAVRNAAFVDRQNLHHFRRCVAINIHRHFVVGSRNYVRRVGGRCEIILPIAGRIDMPLLRLRRAVRGGLGHGRININSLGISCEHQAGLGVFERVSAVGVACRHKNGGVIVEIILAVLERNFRCAKIMRVAEPLFEIHVEVTVAVRTASCLAWISSQSLIIWRIWRVNVERSRRNIFEINRLASAARSRGVENLVRCVRTIVVAINMLAVIIQLPRGLHDLVIKTIILRVARRGVWAAIAHHGIVFPF